MIQNKVVARFLDGRVLKGTTSDFMPSKDFFHLMPADGNPGTQIQSINLRDCKAVFFVKDFTGKPDYQEKKEFPGDKTVGGRKIKVVFKDNEILIGTTQGYQPGRPGLFLFPADRQSNTERCFVVSSATKEISFL